MMVRSVKVNRMKSLCVVFCVVCVCCVVCVVCARVLSVCVCALSVCLVVCGLLCGACFEHEKKFSK